MQRLWRNDFFPIEFWRKPLKFWRRKADPFCSKSLGGVESLLTYPMKQTHADVPVEAGETLGVDESF